MVVALWEKLDDLPTSMQVTCYLVIGSLIDVSIVGGLIPAAAQKPVSTCKTLLIIFCIVPNILSNFSPSIIMC